MTLKHPFAAQVHFATKQKLNIVLERAAEWAVVKHVRGGEDGPGNAKRGGVTEGSALVAVNEASTMLQPYQDTIRLLTGWWSGQHKGVQNG